MMNNSIVRNFIFIGFHLTPLLALISGVSLGAFLAMLVSYFVFVFGVTAGYHRYFSHRTFDTSRVMQFILALLGTLSLQKGVLQWSANHRDHHTFSDKEGDPHSPVLDGFWWSHIGWIMSEKYVETRWERIKDFAKFPELVWLNAHWQVPFTVLCALVSLTLGFQYLVWACFIPIVLSWHSTFAVNSLLHVWGKKVYKTRDESRNNYWLAIPTMGEAFHNNHHYYPGSMRQGFKWYELDLSYCILWALEKMGIIWNVKRPPQKIVEATIASKKD